MSVPELASLASLSPRFAAESSAASTKMVFPYAAPETVY
jgi:hypothetical protein